jgi:predicted outer membrane protein
MKLALLISALLAGAAFGASAAQPQQGGAQPMDSPRRNVRDWPNGIGTQSPPDARSQGSMTEKQVGSRIVNKLHQANLLEIQAGGLAQQNGTTDVQQIGRLLVDDHKKADIDLINLATKLNISLLEAGQPSATDKTASVQASDAREFRTKTALIDDLRDVKGTAFDKQFLTMMVRDHDGLIAAVRASQAQLSAGADLRRFLDDTLPTLLQHRDAAQRLLTRLLPQGRRGQE